MKATERKRLKQNTLQERLSDVVGTIRKPPSRRVWLWVFLLCVLGVGIFFFFRMRRLDAIETAQNWVFLDDGTRKQIDELAKSAPSSEVGKAALFQRAWIFAWDNGIKRLATDEAGAMENLKAATSMYQRLRDYCKGDPIWEPEALYNLAVIEETKAVTPFESQEHLRKAQKMYSDVAKEYPDSAHGKLAKKRAEQLKSGSKSFSEIDAFYRGLSQQIQGQKQRMGIPQPRAR